MGGEPKQKEFSQVALVHLDSIYRLSRRLTGNSHEAEDLVQETYLRAFRAFETFENRDGGALPWLMKICHNAFYTRLGKVAREPISVESTEGLASSVELDMSELVARSEKLPWEALDDQVKRAIERLPASQREVLLLWAVEQMSYKQIAEVCQIALGTVMSRLHRARTALLEYLEEYCQEHGLTRRLKGVSDVQPAPPTDAAPSEQAGSSSRGSEPDLDERESSREMRQ